MISQKRAFEIVEIGQADDRTSRFCDIFFFILIIVNVIAVCLETVDSIYADYKTIFKAIEFISVSIFALEYAVRIWSSAAAPNIKNEDATTKRLRYVFSFSGIVDLLAILPSIIPLLFGSVDLRWLRVLRLARLLKFSHYSSALEDLFSAIRHEIRSFTATLYLFGLAFLLSSSLIYLFEHEIQPENFSSIPQAMWWSMVTLTTVGYGDIVPLTVAGKLIATLTAIMGVCVVALLTGIVATGFTNQISMRRNQLEAEINSALSDGILSTDELAHIEELRKQLNISEDDLTVIMRYLIRSKDKT